MISWFWLNTDDFLSFVLSLPMQIGVVLLLVSASSLLVLRGWTGAANLLAALACGASFAQAATFFVCLVGGFAARFIDATPSPYVELMTYLAIGATWVLGVGFVGTARSWWRLGRPMLASVDRAGATRLGRVAGDLVALQIGILPPLCIVGLVTAVGFGLQRPVVEGAACLIALAVWIPLGTLIWNGLRGPDIGPLSHVEAGAAPGELGAAMTRWAVGSLVRGLAFVVALLLGLLTLLRPDVAGWWPLLGTFLVGGAGFALPTLRSLAKGEVRRYSELRVARRAVRSGILGVVVLLGASIELPGAAPFSWALDWMRPWVSSDEVLARRIMRSPVAISDGLGLWRLVYTGWRLADELRGRGPTTVRPIARMLERNRDWIRKSEPKSWRRHQKTRYMGSSLVLLLGQSGQVHPPRAMLTEWSKDATLPENYRGAAGMVLRCLDRGGFVRKGECTVSKK